MLFALSLPYLFAALSLGILIFTAKPIRPGQPPADAARFLADSSKRVFLGLYFPRETIPASLYSQLFDTCEYCINITRGIILRGGGNQAFGDGRPLSSSLALYSWSNSRAAIRNKVLMAEPATGLVPLPRVAEANSQSPRLTCHSEP